jgi:acyl-CoA synthetase (AMP-forming)/AMP-acid ligase II
MAAIDRREPMSSLFALLERRAAVDPSGIAVASGDCKTTYGWIASRAGELAGAFSEFSACRVGVALPGGADWATVLCALEANGADAIMLSASIGLPEAAAVTDRFGLAAIVRREGNGLSVSHTGATRSAASGSRVVLMTSGSTGRPKAVEHSWASLLAAVRSGHTSSPKRWLLTYPAHLYSGIQVTLQCFTPGGTLTILPPAAMPASICSMLRRDGIQCVSASPSFFRQLLTLGDREDLRQAPIEQITLGGEPATDDLLRRLAQLHPNARITHIYAATEVGRCFAVSDGRSGFPSEYLDGDMEGGAQLRIEDGELLVKPGPGSGKSAWTGRTEPAGTVQPSWFRTGDIVEVVGERVYFRGRKTDIINVGGNKVHPMEVEEVLRSVPGVGNVRIYPVPSSIVGQLVAADVVPEGSVEPDHIRAGIARASLDRLRPYQRPRQVNIVAALPLLEGQKIDRRI